MQRALMKASFGAPGAHVVAVPKDLGKTGLGGSVAAPGGIPGKPGMVRPCPYVDVRLTDAEKGASAEESSSLPVWVKTSSFNKMLSLDTSLSNPASSADEYVAKGKKGGENSKLFSAPAAYHVVQRGCASPFSCALGDAIAACSDRATPRRR